MFGHNTQPGNYETADTVSQGKPRLGDLIDYQSHQAIRNSMANLSSQHTNGIKQRIYSSGNPLKMIKEYQTNKSLKQGLTGSMSFKSNASTNAF